MTDPDLADRILAALTESERLDREPVMRSDKLLAQLAAAEDDVRAALYTLDTEGLVRFTPGFVAGDVVVLLPQSRDHLGRAPLLPPEPDDEPST
jgi:hypothetical protein